ncbi:MAG: hypothetical protein E7214_14105 [Clostridium sp.]|nr:hypothetical protein [Clostridium sp.]
MKRIESKKDLKWGFPFYKKEEIDNSNYRYLIKYDHEVGPGMDFHECLVKIAEANKDYASSNNTYICYGSWIGKGIVWRFYDLDTKDDSKDILTDEEVLEKKFGEEGKKINKDFRDTLITEDKKLIKYIPQLSNSITTEEYSPYPYIYYFEIELTKDYKVIENELQKLKEAASNNNINFIVYAEENNTNLHLFIPIKNFIELDSIGSVKEILNSYYNKEESANIRSEIYKIMKKNQSTLMTLVTNCDNTEFDIIE